MKKPVSVSQCELIVYVSLMISAFGSLANKWLGTIGPGEFAFQLLVYGLLCMIPYKIGRGSNPARYVYVVISAITLLLMVGGGVKVPKLDLIISVVMIPVEIYVSWTLFQPAASRWFNDTHDDKDKTQSWTSRSR